MQDTAFRQKRGAPLPGCGNVGRALFCFYIENEFHCQYQNRPFSPPSSSPAQVRRTTQSVLPLQKQHAGQRSAARPKASGKTRFSAKRQAVWLEGRSISNKTCSLRKARHAARHHRLRPEALRHGRSASGKSLPRRLSAQYKSCFSRAASLRCWSQRRLFVHGAAPFLRGKKPRRSIRRRENAGAYPIGRAGRCSIPSNEGAMFSTLQHIRLL